MQNKRLGIIFLSLGIIISIILLQFMDKLSNDAREIGCFDNPKCIKIESTFNITHLAFGVIGFISALGFYLLFFSKGEEAILKRLEEEKDKKIENEKFSLIAKGLDDYEKKVLLVIKDENGITQNTLRLKTDMSKAKLSYVLKDLETKKLIKKVQKGKTFAVYFTGI